MKNILLPIKHRKTLSGVPNYKQAVHDFAKDNDYQD